MDSINFLKTTLLNLNNTNFLKGGQTNNQFTDLVSQAVRNNYSDTKEIIQNRKWKEQIEECMAKSVSGEKALNDLKDLPKVCGEYSIISFIKDSYLLPGNIEAITKYLNIKLFILVIIIVLLGCIFFLLLFK